MIVHFIGVSSMLFFFLRGVIHCLGMRAHVRACVRVCVRVCVRACVRAQQNVCSNEQPADVRGLDEVVLASSRPATAIYPLPDTQAVSKWAVPESDIETLSAPSQ
jgi:hypothetical protein